MKFYQEITLIADDEITPYFLWSRVYTQLHIALADVKNQHNIQTIGVGFPQYRYEKSANEKISTLGNKLRVFSQSENDLIQLNLSKWLSKLSDYAHIKPIKNVPEPHTFAIYQRYNPKELEQVAKRFAMHKGIDFEQALSHCQTHKTAKQDYPFIALKSESTGNYFNLHIKKVMVDKAKQGEFGCYGLSTNASVPEFK